MKDSYKREIDYLRLSLTDRCQLRCCYCVPEAGVAWTPIKQLLTDQEITKIVQTFAKLGVSKLKLTGGEPLLRPGVVSLIKRLKAIAGIEEITLTTNGVKLAEMIADLAESGLDGVNISLDTLDKTRYQLMTRKNQLDVVLKGIGAAVLSNIKKVKVNCVLIEQLNKDELLKIAKLAKDDPIHVRFIEWMPISGEGGLKAVSEIGIQQILRKHYGPLKSVTKKLGNGPARYLEIEGFEGKIGFISAMSHHFCGSCNRVRVTSDGFLKTCLYFNKGADLKAAIQKGNLETQIVSALKLKPKGHRFNKGDKEDEREQKSMIQIGG